MIEENNVCIHFPGISLKIARPISTISLITPFERSTKGCYRKCPCRVWVQCNYYNKMRRKKSRGDEKEYWKDIWDYYNNAFKLTIDMSVTNMNG